MVFNDTLHEESEELNIEESPHWDENIGCRLDPTKVRQERECEMAHFKQRGVYTYVRRSEAQSVIGGKFIGTRWVQCNKGDTVRCRLVAQKFANGDPRSDLFAGTPPLFAARLLVSRVASRTDRDWTLMALDVSCAFLYAPVKRDLFIELPVEDPASASGEWVGKLQRAMYGTRDSPQMWF